MKPAERVHPVTTDGRSRGRYRRVALVALLAFGLVATLRDIAPTTLRDVPTSPDGGLIADYQGDVDDPTRLARHFETRPGVIDHGLFPPTLTSDILIAVDDKVERRTL